MNWIRSAVYGLLAGFATPTPLSPEAHGGVMEYLLGKTGVNPLLALVVHAVTLLVLLTVCRSDAQRLLWAHELDRRSRRRRRAAPPDRNSLNTVRLLRTAGFPTVLGTLLSPVLDFVSRELWMLTIPLTISGFVLLLPTRFPTGNKDGRHLLRADGWLLGLCGFLSCVPGLSLMAMVCAAASIRGASRSYGLHFGWMLLMMRLVTLLALDGLTLVLQGADWSVSALIAAAVAGGCASLGAWLGVYLMGGLSQSTGVDGFAYYNWGMALIVLGLYLFV